MATTQRICEACGTPLPPPGNKGGRPPRWCSSACRSRAARARLSGSGAGTPVPGIAAEHAVDQVLASPDMTRRLLLALADAINNDELDGVEHNPVIDALSQAHAAMIDRIIAANPIH